MEESEQDELRLCPICRMKVSVWATKCHHCGEELGRPRREETKLTLKDLGGSQQTTYTPSGNVTGALESFRVEEVAADSSRNAPERRGLIAKLFGKEPPVSRPAPSDVEATPELDEYSKNLAASLLDDMSSTRAAIGASRAEKATVNRAELVVKVVGGLVAVVLLYFVGSFAWGKMSAYMEARNAPPEIRYENKAPEMLARGEESIDVFEEAIKAVGINNTPANQDIADQVRRLVLADVDRFLAKNPWKSADQDKAYSYIQRAVNVDNHPAVAAKFEEVNAEVALYKFVLKSINDAATEAVFRPNHPNYPQEVTVERADRFMDRFIIERINKHGVDLNDDKYDGRRLTIKVNEGVESRY